MTLFIVSGEKGEIAGIFQDEELALLFVRTKIGSTLNERTTDDEAMRSYVKKYGEPRRRMALYRVLLGKTRHAFQVNILREDIQGGTRIDMSYRKDRKTKKRVAEPTFMTKVWAANEADAIIKANDLAHSGVCDGVIRYIRAWRKAQEGR